MAARAHSVAVLMGGPSEEHDVSLKSGQGVVKALTARGWTAHPVIIPKTSTVDAACHEARSALQRLRPSVAFLALHGPFGEDGTIQQVCDALSVPYTGSDAAASRLGIDKVLSRGCFERAGLAVPRWKTVESSASIPVRELVNGWSYPLVVKPVSQGSSLGVSIVRSPEELPAALQAAGAYGPRVLMEAFVSGREVTVGVVGDRALPVVEIKPSHPFFDYSAKYTSGLTEYVVPAPLPPAVTRVVQEAGLAAHRALGCRHVSRTDLILTREGVPVILEVNTIPGFTPTSLLPKAAACAGLSYDELCEQLVWMALHALQPVGSP